MIAALRNPVGRLALAIALSALLHAAILWLPYIHFPHAKVELPPLTVRLEHVPEPVEQVAAKPEPANPITKTGSHPSTRTAAQTVGEMDKTEESEAAQPFPKHVRLTFEVHNSAGGYLAGEIHHQLDVRGNSYTLEATKRSSGVASLRNSGQNIQTSHGKIGAHGLQPETFEEEDVTRSGKQSMHAAFDRTAKKLRYSHGDEIALPEDAQDSLSFMYQLSQLPMSVEFFPIPVSDAAHLEQYQIEVGMKEDIDTPLGKLHTLHLRKMHAQGADYFEIWLGLEYRLLPVKFIRVDGSGKVFEESVISDIRAADE